MGCTVFLSGIRSYNAEKFLVKNKIKQKARKKKTKKKKTKKNPTNKPRERANHMNVQNKEHTGTVLYLL